MWVTGSGLNEAADRLVSGDDGRQRDHGDDEDAGQVFGSSVAVGVAAVAARRPRTKAIHSGSAVSASEKLWMVSASSATDPVSSDDDGLQHSGDEQRHQADLDCADALGAGLQRGVDRVRAVVAVRTEDRQQGTADVPSVPVPMPVPMSVPGMAVPVPVAVVGRGVRFGVLLRGHLVRVRSARRIMQPCARAMNLSVPGTGNSHWTTTSLRRRPRFCGCWPTRPGFTCWRCWPRGRRT